MTTRTTKSTVMFTRPFNLTGFDGEQPAGSYSVETDEELLEGMSFPAYRRMATMMQLDAPSREFRRHPASGSHQSGSPRGGLGG